MHHQGRIPLRRPRPHFHMQFTSTTQLDQYDTAVIGCVLRQEAATPDPNTGVLEELEQGKEEAVENDLSDVEQLQERIKELEEETEKKHDQLLRTLADAENVRRRATIDVENSRKFAVEKFAKSLLDVADNLNRAVESVPVFCRLVRGCVRSPMI